MAHVGWVPAAGTMMTRKTKLTVTLTSEEWAHIIRVLDGNWRAHPVDSPLIADAIKAQVHKENKG